MKALKLLRVAVAAGVFALITLFFLGLGGGCGLLERIQLVPALLGCAVVPLVVWFVVTLVFGRVYCSMACPLGILQDVLRRVLPHRRASARPDHPGARLAALVVFAALLACGGASLAGLIDPYGVFGRIASELFQPVAEGVNNLLADCLGVEGPVVLFKREVLVRSVSGFAVAASALALLAALVAWKGRVVCNTVCPVGAALALASRRTLFGIAIDPAKCVACGRCAASCKALCLDGANKTVDNARCVRCFDCLGACARGAISFGRLRPQRAEGGGAAAPAKEVLTRRAGLAALGACVALPVTRALAPRAATGETGPVPLPPGADLARLRARCTACGLCVARCPKKVIAPAGFAEFGVLGFMLPKMDFARGFCDPDCTRCGEVCPSGAIRLLDVAAKKTWKIGVAAFDRKACLTCAEGLDCGLCERRCPRKAISLKEEMGGKDGKQKVSVPVVDAAACTGCGACEHYCPVGAFRVGPRASVKETGK